MDLHALFMKHALDVVELLTEKNELYGDENLLEYGLLGVTVRLRDKLARLEHQIFSDSTDPETVEDIFMDIAGYAINALRLYREGRMTNFGRLSKYIEEGEDEKAQQNVHKG